jgi:HSP20 family molecular chaperone IbpA
MNQTSSTQLSQQNDSKLANEKLHAQVKAPVREVRPRVDIFENNDELLMLADMPGATSDSVGIRVENSLLIMQAQRTGTAAANVQYHRAFQVPDTVDPDGISAELKNGVLHVHLRKYEKAKPRAIPIRAS